VGVYGDHDGAWVDEDTPCRPVSKRSRQRVEAELAWRRFAADTGVPVAVIRLSGIYGPGRGPFEKIRRGTARRIIKPGQVFNRIHVDDIAAIVEAAFLRRADGLFNGTDDEPAPPGDVLAYAAELLGVPPPPEVPYESAELSPMARSFYGENKRVRNDKIKRELGVELRYSTFREGLRAVQTRIAKVCRTNGFGECGGDPSARTRRMQPPPQVPALWLLRFCLGEQCAYRRFPAGSNALSQYSRCVRYR
jgi:nucleoside-diphosphate-sugar epimerase